MIYEPGKRVGVFQTNGHREVTELTRQLYDLAKDAPLPGWARDRVYSSFDTWTEGISKVNFALIDKAMTTSHSYVDDDDYHRHTLDFLTIGQARNMLHVLARMMYERDEQKRKRARAEREIEQKDKSTVIRRVNFETREKLREKEQSARALDARTRNELDHDYGGIHNMDSEDFVRAVNTTGGR